MTPRSNLPANALRALTTVALALPAIQGARGETLITRPQTDFGITHVNEGKDHYRIDVYAARLALALSPKMDLTVRANQDVMTGTSTYTYLPGAVRKNAAPLTLVASRSGNSIHDHRSAADVNVRYFGDDYHVGVGGTISEENFYESQTLHLNLTNEFNKSNTELSWGYSVSNDSIRPTVAAYIDFAPYSRVTKRQGKLTQRFSFEAKQDLSKTTVAQAGVEFIADRGYMDDPYKVVTVYGNPNRSDGDGAGQVYLSPPILGFIDPTGALAALFPDGVAIARDRRPDYRGALATSAKIIQYITPLNAAIHVGYRFANNTWKIKSHTFTLDYFQDFNDSWQVIPSFRYYSQSEAYFYGMVFDSVGTSPIPGKRIGNTGPASSDFRLGKFGSLTSELKVHYKFLEARSAKFTVVFGHINRRNKFYLGKKPYPLNPDNDFKTYYGSLGFSYIF